MPILNTPRDDSSRADRGAEAGVRRDTGGLERGTGSLILNVHNEAASAGETRGGQTTRRAMKGTIDFHYSFTDDIVFAQPRGALEVSCDVMRWYELQANYLRARFRHPKDLVTIDGAMVVAPKVAALRDAYQARLLDELVRFSVRVTGGAANGSPRSSVPSLRSSAALEAPTVEEAVAMIYALRVPPAVERPSAIMRATRPGVSGERPVTEDRDTRA